MTEKDYSDNPALYPKIVRNNKSESDSISKEIKEKIKGKSLDIYYFLVTNPGSYGVREIQREFQYKSPSLAAYHLDRLLNYNLIKKTENGRYYVEGKPQQLGELRDHFTFLGLYIPRVLLYAYHGLLSIIAAIVLFYLEADTLIWAGYLLFSNIVFMMLLLTDALKFSRRLRPSD